MRNIPKETCCHLAHTIPDVNTLQLMHNMDKDHRDETGKTPWVRSGQVRVFNVHIQSKLL